jgi:CcmD family protein
MKSLSRFPLRMSTLSLVGAVLVALFLLPTDLFAQASAAAPRMRDFWHVFIAYGVAWALLFGWVFAIFRRLGRIQSKLDAG